MSLVNQAVNFLQSPTHKEKTTKVGLWLSKQDTEFQDFFTQYFVDGGEIRKMWTFCTTHGLDASETAFRVYVKGISRVQS